MSEAEKPVRWRVQLRMRDGTFTDHAEGYETKERAQRAARRAFGGYHRTWRVVSSTGETWEATLEPRKRSGWRFLYTAQCPVTP
jgi:hypothetical protein